MTFLEVFPLFSDVLRSCLVGKWAKVIIIYLSHRMSHQEHVGKFIGVSCGIIKHSEGVSFLFILVPMAFDCDILSIIRVYHGRRRTINQDFIF